MTKNLEDLCNNCGKCCHCTLGVNGTSIALRKIVCKFLIPSKTDSTKTQCSIYRKRFSKVPWCMSAWEAIEQKRLPHDCPYVRDDPEYLKGHNVDYISPALEPIVFSENAKAIDVRKLLIIGKPWSGPDGE